MQRWCAGLRLDAERPISDEEAVYVLRRLRGLWVASLATMVAGAVALTCGLVLFEFAMRPGALAQRPYLLFASGLTIGALCPLLCTLAIRRLQMVRRLRADLGDSRVEGYLGVVGPEPSNAAQARLVSAGLLLPDGKRRQCLEVLPHSNTILRINGRAAPPDIVAVTSELAATQPHRFTTALPRELVDVLNNAGLDLERRSLSHAERTELDGHAQRFRRRFRWTIGLAAAGATSLGAWFSQHLSQSAAAEPWVSEAMAWFGATVLLGLVAWMAHALWLRTTHRIEADKKLSWVITVREPDGHADEPKFEILPTSRLLWTEGERPAGWRFDHR